MDRRAEQLPTMAHIAVVTGTQSLAGLPWLAHLPWPSPEGHWPIVEGHTHHAELVRQGWNSAVFRCSCGHETHWHRDAAGKVAGIHVPPEEEANHPAASSQQSRSSMPPCPPSPPRALAATPSLSLRRHSGRSRSCSRTPRRSLTLPCPPSPPRAPVATPSLSLRKQGSSRSRSRSRSRTPSPSRTSLDALIQDLANLPRGTSLQTARDLARAVQYQLQHLLEDQPPRSLPPATAQRSAGSQGQFPTGPLEERSTLAAGSEEEEEETAPLQQDRPDPPDWPTAPMFAPAVDAAARIWQWQPPQPPGPPNPATQPWLNFVPPDEAQGNCACCQRPTVAMCAECRQWTCTAGGNCNCQDTSGNGGRKEGHSGIV